MPSSVSPRKRQDDGWSFDFRTSLHFMDSDDSGQEDEPSAPAPPTVSAEAKLLKDMDLSTREEAVAYKPNPFSIAKINAAYRSKAPSKHTKTTHNPPNAVLSTVKPRQKTLAERFELQKKKALLPSRTVPLASQVNVSSAAFLAEGQIPFKKSPSPPRLLTAVSPKPVGPVFHDSYKENYRKTSQNAHILTNNLSCSGKDSQAGYENNNLPLRRRSSVLSFSSPTPLPSFSNQTNQDDTFTACYSSPIKPHPSYNRRFLQPRPFSNYNDHRRRVLAGVNPLQNTFSAHNDFTQLRRIKTHAPHVCERSIKYEDGVNNNNIFPGFQDGANNFESTNKIDLNLDTVNGPLVHRQQESIKNEIVETLLGTSVSIIPNNSRIKLQPKKDAYLFSVQDSDEEWTTLPPRKKKKKLNTPARSAPPKFTKPFRLPGVLPIPNSTRTQGSTAYRRDHTYLPPPLAPAPTSLSTNKLHGIEPRLEYEVNRHEYLGHHQQDLGEEIQRNNNHTPLNKVMKDDEVSFFAFGAEAYPSPKQINLPRPVTPQSPRLHRTAELDVTGACELETKVFAYRPPSPPTSDLPIPTDFDAGEKEIHVAVDIKRIKKEYQFTRALGHKRRRACAEVWDILKLESCGIVCKDKGMMGMKKEIEIVRWAKECWMGRNVVLSDV